jgi:ferredoxin
MAIRIVIDEQECDGCETCVEMCPEVFMFDEDANVAKVIDPEADADCIENAFDACPAECINLEED